MMTQTGVTVAATLLARADEVIEWDGGSLPTYLLA
jgi:hypothetical protein